jgi:hypothetical protein
VEDSPRPGPAFTAVTEDNIAAVENVVWENRRVTVKEVASVLDISVGSAHHIFHDELKFRKVCARWVPKRLTPEMKERRVDACQELLRRYEADGEAFLQRIVTFQYRALQITIGVRSKWRDEISFTASGPCVYFPVATVRLWWLTVTPDSTRGCVVTVCLRCVAGGYGLG